MLLISYHEKIKSSVTSKYPFGKLPETTDNWELLIVIIWASEINKSQMSAQNFMEYMTALWKMTKYPRPENIHIIPDDRML